MDKHHACANDTGRAGFRLANAVAQGAARHGRRDWPHLRHDERFAVRVIAVTSESGDRGQPAAAFYNHRGTAERWIKEGKGAIRWTRLSYRKFAANAVRLQLHALAYNLGDFLRTLATPEPIKDWSLTSLREKLIKIGAKLVSHGRYVADAKPSWMALPFLPIHRSDRAPLGPRAPRWAFER
jgi:Transposase DDE domain group 1